MSLEPLYLTLLVLLIQAIAYRVLPVLQNRYNQNQRSHDYGNRLPGLLFVLLLMPVFAWIPLRAEDSVLRGTLSFILLWLCPSKFLSIAWDSPIDNLPPGFFYFAIASIIPVKIKGHLNSKPKSSTQLGEAARSFENRSDEHSRSSNISSRIFDEHSRSSNISSKHSPRSFDERPAASIRYSNGPPGSLDRNSPEDSRSSDRSGHKIPEALIYNRLLFRLLQAAFLIATTNAALYFRGKISIFWIYGIYCVYLYTWIDLWWTSLAKMAELTTGMEICPCFNDPFLSTSLSEFWGRRWNPLVNAMLRSTVYNPLLDAFGVYKKKYQKPKKPWRPSEQSRNPKIKDPFISRAVAMMACFVVSGLFHEVFFCYTNRSAHPTWEVTAFFILHGFATVGTVYFKQISDLKLPTWICRVLTLSFIYATAAYLFMPPATRSGADLKSLHTCTVFSPSLFVCYRVQLVFSLGGYNTGIMNSQVSLA